ncbi:MAG: hypothetical protein GX783_04365, partial [Clostridiales bacterium]|nr:hypothetical protein [Clostridiales bacterium]
MGVNRFKKDIKIFLAVLLFSIILYATVQWYDVYIYRFYRIDEFLNWHIGLEGLSIVMSFCIFFISFYTMQRNKNLRTTIFLITFLAVGLLDSMHALTYKGMPGFLSNSSVSTAASYWIAARMTAAVGLTVAALAKRNYTVKFHRFIFVLVSLLYSLIVI